MYAWPAGFGCAFVGYLVIALPGTAVIAAEGAAPARSAGTQLVRNGASEGRGQGPLHLLQATTVDSGEHGDDEARGVAVDEAGNVFVTGYVTIAGEGRNIWLARFDRELVVQDSITVNGSASGDDEGYTIAFDHSGHVFVVGYMTETAEGHNIWLGKFDSDLNLVDELTVNGPASDDDDGYGILFDDASGLLYLAGTVRDLGQGANIWLARFDTSLGPQGSVVVNGPIDDTDKARFMVFDDERHLFVSGSMTQAGTDYDIWIGKFTEDLLLLDDAVIAGPTTEEDKGYGMVFGPPSTIYVTGTMIEPGESYNIWMAEFDTDLSLLDAVTINGPVDGEDVAYMMVRGPVGGMFQTGVYTEVVGGSNVWVAEFDTNLGLRAWTTLDGPASGYDSGIGVAAGLDGDLYVSAIVSDPVDDFNIWIGRFDVVTLFTDGFESGSTSAWSTTAP